MYRNGIMTNFVRAMPWRKKKNQRQSFFSDQVVKDFSVSHCPCELYFPEPSLKLDEFGAIKNVCLSGETLQWSKHCILHLCEIPGQSSNIQFTLQDTGQDCEVCLSVILNRSKSGDFSYNIRDKLWHEYSRKVEERWQRFVFKFDEDDENEYQQFEEKIKNILQEVNRIEDTKTKKSTVYLLVAVQTNLEKRKSSTSLNRHSRLSLLDLRQSGSGANPPSKAEDSSSNSENSPVKEGRDSPVHFSLTDPFDLAPYIPAGEGDFYHENKDTPDVKYMTSDYEILKSINELCDSLHIHPNELPQTLGSILKSAAIKSFDKELKTPTDINPNTSSHLNVPAIHEYKKDDSPERFASEFLPTEELYVTMGFAAVGKQKANQTEENRTIMAEHYPNYQKLHKAQEMAQLLQTSINSNDANHAAEHAKQLAAENVDVTIDVKLKTKAPAEKDNEFNLKVNIEDKESSGGAITLKVKASDTIKDLKNLMLRKHMFPVEVQYWIIGKRIPQDMETLERCKIKNHGFTAFLYLISAKAAGINKEDFMRRQSIQQTPEYGMAQGLQTPASAPELLRTPSRPGSSVTPASAAASSASPGKQKMEPRTLDQNFNIDGKNEKPTPEKLQGPIPGARVKKEAVVNPVRQSGAEIAQVLHQIAPQLGGAVGQYPLTPYGESRQRVPVMHPEENEEPKLGWACPACTYINQPTRPGCELCASSRPADYEIPKDYIMTDEERKRIEMEELIERKTKEVEDRQRLLRQQEQEQNFANLQETDALDLIPNKEPFTCPICFDNFSEGQGIVLRECLHSFCKECLQAAVQYNEEPELECPFLDEDYKCDGIVQDREIRALVNADGYSRYLARGLATAESQAQNSFHCKTADCPGWCIYEDHVNFFVCQVCGKENCLTCKAIHQGMNCKQYQEDLQSRAVNDKAANQTKLMIKRMLDDGDAMNCPQCRVIVMKKEGCDWIQCSICKTEICWITKGPRWGPGGNGDISGGCKCRVNGEVCHQECNNCH